MNTCASGPIPSAYTTVPTPTVPPSSQPVASTVSSMPVRTTRIEWPRAARPVIRPSRGPGPRPAPMYAPVAIPFRTTPPTITTIWAGEGVHRAGTTVEHQVDHQPDHEHVADRPESRALPQRDPQQQDERADDDRPRADAEPEPAREALVKDVPRIDAEPGEQQHRVADPVEHETGVQLGEPSERGVVHRSSRRVSQRMACDIDRPIC